MRATISGAAIRARVQRRAQLLLVQLRRDHVLAVHVPAALREDLVLELDAGDAGALELVHRAHHLRDLAVAGVGVGDHGEGDGRAEAAGVIDHLGRARDAEVGQPEGGRRGRVAAAVHRLEPGALEQPAGERVERARHDQDLGSARVASRSALPRAGDQTPHSASVIGKRSCTCSASRL